MSQSTAIVTKPTSIKQYLESAEIKSRFMEILPSHLDMSRMLRLYIVTVQSNEKLARAEPKSFLGSLLMLASLGLEPNTTLGQAYLIPYEIKEGDKKTGRYNANIIIGYKGLIALAKRSGELADIHADIVNMGDDFSFAYGTNKHLDHIPKWETEDPLCAYAFAKLLNGENSFEVLPWKKIIKIRNQSQGWQGYIRWKKDTPWLNHEDEMAKKTAIRALSKTLQLSPDFIRAATIDARAETGKLDTAKLWTEEGAIENPDLAMNEDIEDAEEPQSFKDKLRSMPDQKASKQTVDVTPEPQPDKGGVKSPTKAEGQKQVMSRLEQIKPLYEALVSWQASKGVPVPVKTGRAEMANKGDIPAAEDLLSKYRNPAEEAVAAMYLALEQQAEDALANGHDAQEFSEQERADSLRIAELSSSDLIKFGNALFARLPKAEAEQE